MKAYKLFLVCLLILCFTSSVIAQSEEIQRGSGQSSQCGDIIEGEFTNNFQEDTFKITLKAGDKLDLSVVPIGDQMYTTILVTGPTNLGVALSNGEIGPASMYWNEVEREPKIITGKLGATGEYTIRLVNFRVNWINPYTYATDSYRYAASSGGIGAYTLYIGCTLRDGTVINPGDTAPASSQNGSNSNVAAPPTFTGTGFPGLAPVDFTGLNPKILTSSKSVIGAVDGNAITSYTIDAAANDILALEFTRASGNLNLGLVVLSSDNKVVFQASLVTSSELTTKFTLPTAGTYTIGIFRIDLLPPAAPEATAFQLTATLNP